MFINNSGHMTKMTAMPIQSKKPSKIFSGTAESISMKLGMYTPYIRLVKFQLVRQIPDVYIRAFVLAGKLFCCILHRIPKLLMV